MDHGWWRCWNDCKRTVCRLPQTIQVDYGSEFISKALDKWAYDNQVTLEYLQKVYQGREIWNTYLRVEPRLDQLRDDPRFHELVRRVESK